MDDRRVERPPTAGGRVSPLIASTATARMPADEYPT